LRPTSRDGLAYLRLDRRSVSNAHFLGGPRIDGTLLTDKLDLDGLGDRRIQSRFFSAGLLLNDRHTFGHGRRHGCVLAKLNLHGLGHPRVQGMFLGLGGPFGADRPSWAETTKQEWRPQR
jgi:hypothetical protein